MSHIFASVRINWEDAIRVRIELCSLLTRTANYSRMIIWNISKVFFSTVSTNFRYCISKPFQRSLSLSFCSHRLFIRRMAKISRSTYPGKSHTFHQSMCHSLCLMTSRARSDVQLIFHHVHCAPERTISYAINQLESIRFEYNASDDNRSQFICHIFNRINYILSVIDAKLFRASIYELRV